MFYQEAFIIKKKSRKEGSYMYKKGRLAVDENDEVTWDNDAGFTELELMIDHNRRQYQVIYGGKAAYNPTLTITKFRVESDILIAEDQFAKMARHTTHKFERNKARREFDGMKPGETKEFYLSHIDA